MVLSQTEARALVIQLSSPNVFVSAAIRKSGKHGVVVLCQTDAVSHTNLGEHTAAAPKLGKHTIYTPTGRQTLEAEALQGPQISNNHAAIVLSSIGEPSMQDPIFEKHAMPFLMNPKLSSSFTCGVHFLALLKCSSNIRCGTSCIGVLHHEKQLRYITLRLKMGGPPSTCRREHIPKLFRSEIVEP